MSLSGKKAVVIGGGINGLVAATLLTQRGFAVTVAERCDRFGGLAAGDEFHPGYRGVGTLQDTIGLRPWVEDLLQLRKFGLQRRTEEVPVLALPRDGSTGLLLWRDVGQMTAELASHNAKDQAAYGRYRAFVGEVADFLRTLIDAPPPNLDGILQLSPSALLAAAKPALGLRRLGRKLMLEILRVLPMCAADFLNEWFCSETLKGALCGTATYPAFAGPWSPGTTANLLLAEAFAGEQREVVGGPTAVVTAVLAAAQAAGVTLRTSATVQRIVLANGRARGVELHGGELIEADVIFAACDPKQVFLELIDSAALTRAFTQEAAAIRCRGTAAVLDLALSAYPSWRGRSGFVAEAVRIGGSLDDLERAFDPVKYGALPDRPALEVRLPTVNRPELAPAGHHVAQVMVHCVPEDLRAVSGGWSNVQKQNLLQTVLSCLEQVAPGLGRLVVAHRLMTPPELRDAYALSGGHLHHAEAALDQLFMRPVAGASRYATPIANLFLCGAGSHPGGGVTGAPGALAVQTVDS